MEINPHNMSIFLHNSTKMRDLVQAYEAVRQELAETFGDPPDPGDYKDDAFDVAIMRHIGWFYWGN